MNTMRPTTSTSSRVVPALLAAVVAFIVLGIIGMHALNTHGVMSSTEHSTMTSSVTSPMTGVHGDMSASSDSGDGHSVGSMVMLCFAMLAATAGALLLVLPVRRRRPRARAQRRTAPTTVAPWVTTRLGTGPPYVWQFSVIRC